MPLDYSDGGGRSVSEIHMEKQVGRAIGPWGTVGRLVFGIGFLYLAWYLGLSWWETLLGAAVFPAVLILWQGFRLIFTSDPIRANGPMGYCLNFGVGTVFFMLAPSAAFTFYGLSLLLAAARGYAGCEILAIPNWLLRRDDQVGCVVFSPIDAVEAQLAVRGRRGNTDSVFITPPNRD